MNILLKSITIYDRSSRFHKQTKDILIENGIIAKIDKDITLEFAAEVIDGKGLYVSRGWLDSSVSFGEPGFEERQTIENGLKTAALSGFTDVVVNTNIFPRPENAVSISYLKEKSKNNAVSLHPLGNLTQGAEGKYLTELSDMRNNGAIGFYDYQKPIKNADVLMLALQYIQDWDTLICSFPLNQDTAGVGIVNEGVISAKLGIKGISSLSENLQVSRDLSILNYTKGKLHIPTISSKRSVSLIEQAKARGLDISSSVAISNLVFTDNVLDSFDPNFKLLPPLRTEKDRVALIEGVRNSTIDFVVSDHYPLNEELKKIDFYNAGFGSIGLESFFGALCTLFNLEEVVSILTRYKDRFGIPIRNIEVGQEASLSIFTYGTSRKFNEKDIISTSKNSNFLGVTLNGEAVGIISNNKAVINKKWIKKS